MTEERKRQISRLYNEDLWDLYALNECSIDNEENDEEFREYCKEENEFILTVLKDREEDELYTPSATHGDYSPSNPWDAPGMSVRDFI